MQKGKVVAIIQAHMSSTRLPGKVLKPFCGEPALYRMLERVRQSRLLDDVVVATSSLPCDDVLVECCSQWGIHTFRGSDEDVLSRYWGAAKMYPAEVYVRMTSDCPVLDSRVLDRVLQYYFDHDFRYVTPQGFPVGCGMEVFEASLLKEAAENSTEHYEHEHVTPYMYWKQTSIGRMKNDRDWSGYRVTLDTQEDYAVITAVYDALYQPGNTFTVAQIVEFLDAHPEVRALNANVHQKGAKE